MARKISNETGLKFTFYPHCGPDGSVERPLHGHVQPMSVGMSEYGMTVDALVHWGPGQFTMEEALEELIRLTGAESDSVCKERRRRRGEKVRKQDHVTQT